MQPRVQPEPSAPAAARILVVRSGGQFAVLAADDVATGDVLLAVHGRIVDVPSRHSVQVGENRHVDLGNEPDLERDMDEHGWRFLNHSCDPNAMFRGRQLIARRPIPRFQEVTFDYTTTEFDMQSPFECRCGSARCLCRIAGFRHLTLDQQLEREPCLASHLRARLARSDEAADRNRPPTAS